MLIESYNNRYNWSVIVFIFIFPFFCFVFISHKWFLTDVVYVQPIGRISDIELLIYMCVHDLVSYLVHNAVNNFDINIQLMILVFLLY